MHAMPEWYVLNEKLPILIGKYIAGYIRAITRSFMGKRLGFTTPIRPYYSDRGKISTLLSRMFGLLNYFLGCAISSL